MALWFVIKISVFWIDKMISLSLFVNFTKKKLRIGTDSKNNYNIAISICWWLMKTKMKLNTSDLNVRVYVIVIAQHLPNWIFFEKVYINNNMCFITHLFNGNFFGFQRRYYTRNQPFSYFWNSDILWQYLFSKGNQNK